MQFGHYKRYATLSDGWTLESGITLSTYVGGYNNFIQYQKSASRKPTFSVMLESFGDVSSDIKSFDVGSEITDTLHQPSFGHGNIVISDPTGAYMQGSKSLIETGLKVFLFAGFNDMNIPIWQGLVTEAKPDTSNHIVNLSIAQMGYLLSNKNTSGNFDSYNTPVTMVNYLAKQVGISQPVYENEAGVPTTTTLGDTFQENDRSMWAMVHGACLNIFYVPYFDINGVLNLKIIMILLISGVKIIGKILQDGEIYVGVNI